VSENPAPYELLLAMLLVQNSLERRSEAFFQPFGLTASKFNILNLLSMKNGQMDQSELVGQLLVGKSSISIVLNRMVRDNLIRRKPHPNDRRQVVLVITKKGNEIWSKVAPDYEANAREVFGKVPPSHRNQFLQDLKKLHEAISEPVARTQHPSMIR
jgi:DNA-binding MarR family transcriptional regulator